MIAGKQRHRVKFWRAVDTEESDTNEPVRSWTLIGTVNARIGAQDGREQDIGGGINAERETQIVCRYSSQLAGVTEKDRAEFSGVFYNIAAIDHVGLNHREIRFACKSGANPG